MLLEEFSTIFDRPEKVKKLREYILSLAVRGKLVPQDESDEPASVLLNRIREEKERLVREKKIKNEKPLPEISEDEIPYELPDGWEWVRLNEIVSILGDGLHGTPVYSDTGEYYFVNGNNLNKGRIEIKANTKKVELSEFEKYKKPLNENTMFISINGTLGNLAFYNNEKIILGKSACYFNLLNDINKMYMFWMLKSGYVVEYLNSMATGTTIKNVSLKSMKLLSISLPPLNEQKRIAEKVDYLMEFCDKLETQLEKKVKYGTLSVKSALNSVSNCSSYEELEEALRFIIENFKDLTLTDGAVGELKNAILSLAVKGKLVPQDGHDEPASVFLDRIREEKERLVKEKKIKKEKPLPEIGGDEIPYELPRGWEWVRLNDICSLITDGTHSTPKYTESGVPFLSVKDLSKGFIDFSNTKYISKEEHEQLIKRCNPQYGDILLTKIGTTGIAKSIDVDKEFSIFVSVALLKIFNEYIDSVYLEKLINSPLVKKQSEENTQGVGNKNLVLKYIKNFIVPIPPLNEQKRIVEKVDKLMKVCDELELRIEESKKYNEQLMESILKNSLKA